MADDKYNRTVKSLTLAEQEQARRVLTPEEIEKHEACGTSIGSCTINRCMTCYFIAELDNNRV